MQNQLESRTLSIPEAAHMIGVSAWLAGEEIRRTNKLAGIPVIRIGRRILIPREALERVLEGEMPNVPEVSQQKQTSNEPGKPSRSLTPRERLVAELSEEGYSVDEIAGHLGISEKSVERHQKNLERKFGVPAI